MILDAYKNTQELRFLMKIKNIFVEMLPISSISSKKLTISK